MIHMADGESSWHVSRALARKEPSPTVERQAKILDRIVDRIYERNLDIIEGMAAAADYGDDIDPDVVTEEEAQTFGGKKAAQRAKRIARDARMSAKEAPVYLKYATQVATSIARAKAQEKAPAVAIQVNVSLGDTASEATYKVVDLGEEG